jgi:O-antigen/teichoic acid export membrane protein
MKKQFLKSSIFRFLERIVLVVTSLVMTPFFITELGVQEYGYWLLLLSILGWFNIIELGFPTATQRLLIFAIERNPEKVNKVFSTSLLLFFFLAIFAATFLLVISSYLSVFFENLDDIDIVKNLLPLMVIKVVFDFMMNSFHGFYTAFLRLDIDSNLTSLNVLLKAALVFLMLPSLGLLGAVIATLIADVLTNVMKIYYAKKLFSRMKFSFKYIETKLVIEMFSYGKHVIAAGVANMIHNRADPFVVGKLFSANSIAIFGVASNLTAHIKAFTFAINDAFAPVFTKKIAQKEDVNFVFSNAISINFFLATSFFIPLIIFSEGFILLWIGEGFELASSIIPILVFSMGCLVLSNTINQVLFAQANHKLIAVVKLIGAIVNLSLSIYFGMIFGLIGVAIGTAIGFFISDVLISLLLMKKYNEAPITRILFKFLGMNFLVFIIGLIGKVELSVYIDNWWDLILLSSLFFLIATIFAWFILVEQPLRRIILDVVKDKFKKR